MAAIGMMFCVVGIALKPKSRTRLDHHGNWLHVPLINALKKKYDEFTYGRIVLEGAIVSVTEYLMLGAFIFVNFLINHYYGTEVVGVYAVSNAIAQIGIMGIGSVFSLLMRRDLNLRPFDANSYVSKVQILRSSNIFLVLLIAWATTVLFYPPLRPSLNFIMLMVCAKGLDALSETYYTAYQALNRLGEHSFFKILNAVTFSTVSATICLNGYDIHYLYVAHLVSAAVILAINFIRWHQTKTTTIEPAEMTHAGYRFLLLESYPLMIAAMVFQMGVRGNNVLIFDLLGEKELGLFSLIVISVGVFAGVANTLAIVFFGRLSRIFVDDPASFLKRLHQTIVLFLGLGLLFLMMYIVVTPVIMSMIRVEIDSQLYLVMSSAIPFMFVASCLGGIFTIIRRQKIGMFITIAIVLLSLSAYYILTGRFGLIGAGYAFLISAVGQSILIYFAALITLRVIGRDRGKTSTR